jgi:hypothetical protein
MELDFDEIYFKKKLHKINEDSWLYEGHSCSGCGEQTMVFVYHSKLGLTSNLQLYPGKGLLHEDLHGTEGYISAHYFTGKCLPDNGLVLIKLSSSVKGKKDDVGYAIIFSEVETVKAEDMKTKRLKTVILNEESLPKLENCKRLKQLEEEWDFGT